MFALHFRYLVLATVFALFCLIFTAPPVFAIYPPLSVPNNLIGIHILDPSELQSAANLVNSQSGQWGYVTIPIRSDDRDHAKWFKFFLDSRQLHLIPIIRLATYFHDGHWTHPTAYDLVDFANFLSEMPWPTQNRYVVIFNEPNHSAEWGGQVDPAQYAGLLVLAHDIFKTRSSDFFIISAGLDMSAPHNHTSSDALLFWQHMTRAVPQWPQFIDGLAFHAYPNPAFSAPPRDTGRFGIASYRYELQYLTRRLDLTSLTDKPLFITETGRIDPPSDFYSTAFSTVWTEKNLVAVTPFLLFAGTGDFSPLSFLDPQLQPKSPYRQLVSLPKSPGSPLLAPPFAPLAPPPPPNPILPPPAPRSDFIEKFLHFFP